MNEAHPMGTLRFFEEVVSFKIRRTFGFADYKALARLCRDELSEVESKGTEIFRSATVRSRGYTEEVRK